VSDVLPVREQDRGYSGVGLTFSRVPLVLDPAGLAGADAVIVGAPFDLGVSYRPGTRFGPRAIRLGEDSGAPSNRPHMELGIDPFEELRIVDYGDIGASPDLALCHDRLQTAVTEIIDAGATAVVLGGDHSLSLPVMRALASRVGADGYSVIHFDTHADTEIVEEGETTPHAAPFSRAVEQGVLRGDHLVQIGLRGAWPFPAEFAWMRERGVYWYTMDDVEDRGLPSILAEAVGYGRSRAPVTYLTVDIDVLDPAFAPGTGTPEPGGLTTRELLRAVRYVAMNLDLVAMDIVEVSPPYDPAGITALAAHRVVQETLSAMALRKSGRPASPERPAPLGLTGGEGMRT
jgi:agmatinase